MDVCVHLPHLHDGGIKRAGLHVYSIRLKHTSICVWTLTRAVCGIVILQLTYPLDMLRFRIAVDPSCRTISGAVATLLKEGRGAAFYRGLGASLLGEALTLKVGLLPLCWLGSCCTSRGWAPVLLDVYLVGVFAWTKSAPTP